MMTNPEDYEPDPDDLTRDQLAELAHLPWHATAKALDEWLWRMHGVMSGGHHVGAFLEFLAVRGCEVVFKPPLPPLDELLPRSRD